MHIQRTQLHMGTLITYTLNTPEDPHDHTHTEHTPEDHHDIITHTH